MTIITLKILFAIFCFLLPLAALNSWFERKVCALIQDRVGVSRAKILGFNLGGFISTALLNPIKILLKEGFTPRKASKILHVLAPLLVILPVFMCVAAIPFGPSFKLDGQETTMQIANLNVGLIYIFAMLALTIYGVILAGRVSDNQYSLIGALRAIAQVIPRQVVLGLSIAGLVCIYGTLDLSKIVSEQDGVIFNGFLPAWGVFLNPVAFFVFFAAAMACTKYTPFDLSEAKSEIVAGYLTEYSGVRLGLFRLGELATVIIVSALIVILFFGGWHLPYGDVTAIPSDLWGLLPQYFNDIEVYWVPIAAVLVFAAKIAFFCILQITVHCALPRFRYDQLMNLNYKILLSVSVINLLVTAGLVLEGLL